MKSESIVFAVAGMCFGVILGWVIASQQPSREAAAAAPAASASAAAPAERQPPPLDEGRVQQLTATIKNEPQNADARAQLGNVYFDAERWSDAIQWYEQSLKIDPDDPNVSTDLGVSYYYTNRTDEALAQFERSLKLDPNHTKTLLNKGIVLAFGKQDLAAAAEEWKKVVTIAPDSPEGQAARRALEGVAAAHAQQEGGATP
jgi:tetratricopeptide (TPR) repeat protein